MSISTGMVVATRHWRRVCQATLVNYGISEACAMPLLIIGRLGEGVRQVTVAQAAGMESPSLVRLLDQMCKAGYVLRHEDASDRRAKRIKLTEKAEPLIADMEAVINKTRGEILEGISAEEIDLLIKLVARLEHNIIELQ